MKREFTDKQKKILSIAGVAAFLLVSVLFIIFAGKPIVRFASEPEQFREWVSDYGALGMLAYVGMVFLQTFFAVIPGEPFELVAGYAFGAVPGMLLCIAGEVLGSIAVFYFVRVFGMKVVEVFFSKEKISELKFLKETEKRDIVFFLIFMLPGSPKDLLCYFAGLTNIRFGTWLIISSVGRIPSVVTSTVGANALNEGNYGFAIAVFAATLAISGAGLLIYKAVCKKHAEGENAGNEDKL